MGVNVMVMSACMTKCHMDMLGEEDSFIPAMLRTYSEGYYYVMGFCKAFVMRRDTTTSSPLNHPCFV